MRSIPFLVALILIACARRVSDEKILIQVYPFSGSTNIAYKKESSIRDVSHTGELRFAKDKVSIIVRNGSDEVVEEYQIRTIAYENHPNDIKYRTDKGDFTVKVVNDTITEVTLYTDEFLTIFTRRKDVQIIKTQLPIPIGGPKKNWVRVELLEVGSIDLPPTMEIQDEKYRTRMKGYKDMMERNWRVQIAEQRVVLQQKGLNSANSGSSKKYARVILETVNGNESDFSRLNERISFTLKELDNMNVEFRDSLIDSFRTTDLKLKQSFPAQIVEVNGMPAIKISYIRQLRSEPEVMVNLYRFQNNDRMHSLTLSYRISESEQWATVQDEMLKSFRITNIK